MNIKIIKAIADPTRLKLLEKIGEGERCACALPKFVGVSQPTVSQHLKILSKAGLVQKRMEGVKRIYSISSKGARVLRDISRW